MDVLVDGEIILYGTVGEDPWAAASFMARDVVNALAALGRGSPVNVRINSPGGYTDDGAAIYNALKAHRGDITVFVDGIAASAASIVAMAGDKIVMRKGAVMMIHDPSTISVGTSRDHAKSMEMLEAVAGSMADIYAERTGRPIAEIRAEMAEEIWLNAEQAKAKGYVDEIDEADPLNPTAFNYAVYRNAPERIMAFSSAASSSGRSPGGSKPGGKSPPASKKEGFMTQQSTADASTAQCAPAVTAGGIAQTEHDRIVATARAAAETAGRASALAEVGAALAALFPGDARAETFAEALKDGAPLAMAQKFAAKVASSAKTGLHAEMAAARPLNLGAAEATALLQAAGLTPKR